MLADFTLQKKNKILHRKRRTKFCGPAGHLRGPRPRKEEEEEEEEEEEAGRQRKSRNPNLTGREMTDDWDIIPCYCVITQICNKFVIYDVILYHIVSG